MQRQAKIESYKNLQIFPMINVESIFNVWEKFLIIFVSKNNTIQENHIFSNLLLRYLEKPYSYGFLLLLFAPNRASDPIN